MNLPCLLKELFLLLRVNLIKVLILEANIGCIVASIAGVCFLFLLWGDLSRVADVFFGIMGVEFIVGHGVVDVDALVVEELGVGHHCGVLEVLAEAASDQVHVDPHQVLLGEVGEVEVIGVLPHYLYQFHHILPHPFLLLTDASLQAGILEAV